MDRGNPEGKQAPMRTQDDDLDAMVPLRLDHSKYGRHPHVIQQLRRLAHRGRRVTFAIDVALIRAAGGRVYLTRNGRLAIPGIIPNAAWQYIYFEDTCTLIYDRGMEIARADVSYQGKTSSDDETFAEIDSKRMKDPRHGNAITLLNKCGVPTTYCVARKKRRMMGITICQSCFLPQVPRPDFLEGVPGKTLGRLDSPYAQWKKNFVATGKELGIDMKKTGDRYQELKLHPRAISGMFSCFHPIEDTVMHYRTGIQTDTIAAARKAMVNRFLMDEVYVRAMSIDLKIGGEIAKMYNNHVGVLQRELSQCRSFGDVYMLPCMISTLYTRVQFYTSPAGSSLRAAFWYALRNKMALDAFLTKMQRGEGAAIGGAMPEQCAVSLTKHLLADIIEGWKVIKSCLDDNVVKLRYMQNLRDGGAGETTIKSIKEIRVMDFEEARRGSQEVNKQGQYKYETPINVALQTYFLRKFEGGFVVTDPANFGRGPHDRVIEAMFERRNSVYWAPARAFVEKQSYRPARPVVFRGPAMSETEVEGTRGEREVRPRRGERREREEMADEDEGWGDWGAEGKGSERPAEPEGEPRRDNRSRTRGPTRDDWGEPERTERPGHGRRPV